MAFFQAETLWVNQLAEGVAALVLDVPGRKVNVLNGQVFTDLEAALDRVAGAKNFELLLLRSGKTGSFCAGADLRELGETPSAEDCVALAARGQEVFQKLADLPLASVAVISGACLGGGLELALACDYRVLVDRPGTQLGLPEIELGLLPAWGGTQRLPRVIGLERSLQMILAGKRLRPREALQWGLADDLTQEAPDEPPRFLVEPSKRPMHRLPLRTWRQRLIESHPLGRALLFRGAERLLRRRVPDDMPAPWEALQAIRVGLKRGPEAGLAHEREALGRLAVSPASRNLVRLFFRRKQARKALRPAAERTVHRVGIVGAGTRGATLAHWAVLKGCQVVIREAGEMALGLAMLRLMTLLQEAVHRGQLAPEHLSQKLAAVHGTTAWKGYADLDLVVEAIGDDLHRKKDLLQEIEEHISPSTLLATTTAAHRVQDLQEGLRHPGRFGGLNFLPPLPRIPLVEVAGGPATGEETLARLAEWAATLGKTPLQVKDAPGFLVFRVLMPYLNEAAILLSEGVGVNHIDEAMRRFGMAQGPLEFLDQMGLDEADRLALALQPVFAARIEFEPAFAAMTDRGWLGQKAGVGFYHHRGRKRRVNAGVPPLLRDEELARAVESAAPRELMAAARERMVCLMVNEAALCLEEGLVDGPPTVDFALVLGAGWAPHRGGPLQYAEQRGYAAIVESLSQMARYLGSRFEPCPYLLRLAQAQPGQSPPGGG